MIAFEAPKTDKERQDAVLSAVKDIEKEHGKGAVYEGVNSTRQKVDSVPTGIYQLDMDVMGVGGFPKGRISEVYGTECLDAESFIQYEVRVDGKRVNAKGGSIARLYERFHGVIREGDRRGKVRCNQVKNGEFYAPSVNEEGRIFLNRITDVVASGKKNCYRLTTDSGRQIIASEEHKFSTPHAGFIELKNLEVGCTVFVHNNTRFQVENHKNSSASRDFVYVNHHPIAGSKTIRAVVNKSTGERREYEYKRLRLARAVIEADMNGLELTDYIERLNMGYLDGLRFLPREFHVHHKDENVKNNSLDNLSVVDSSSHGVLHATERHNNLRFMQVEETIIHIEWMGIRETYDLCMAAPYNNFVADGFVVHNSGGKTTLALTAIARAQEAGGYTAFIDVEHALDSSWAKTIGVDFDRMLVSQPDYGEQALGIAQRLLESQAFSIIVVDSVAALSPKAEIDGEIGDSVMGQHARMMSQTCRMLTPLVNRVNCALVFINQIREKIGVMFGSPETTPGGRALKFYSSLRLDVRRIGQVKKGDQVVGNKVKIKAAKNKLSRPFAEAEIDLLFNKGFDQWGSIVDGAVERGLITKSGAWYSVGGERIGQGRDAAIDTLASTDLGASIRKSLYTVEDSNA